MTAALVLFPTLCVAIAIGCAMMAGVTTRDALAEHESCERVHAACRVDRDLCQESGTWIIQ